MPPLGLIIAISPQLAAQDDYDKSAKFNMVVSAGAKPCAPKRAARADCPGRRPSREAGRLSCSGRSIHRGRRRAGRSTLALNGGSLAAQEFAERESCVRTRMNSAKT